jgi:hypothetical protein
MIWAETDGPPDLDSCEQKNSVNRSGIDENYHGIAGLRLHLFALLRSETVPMQTVSSNFLCDQQKKIGPMARIKGISRQADRPAHNTND